MSTTDQMLSEFIDACQPWLRAPYAPWAAGEFDPEVFASEDKGATPTEILLVALASCLTATSTTPTPRRSSSSCAAPRARRS